MADNASLETVTSSAQRMRGPFHARNTGGRMRATILPKVIILSKAYRAVVGIMAKRYIVG